MAIKYLKAEKQANCYYFLVHMDDTKLVNDSPDSEYVREYSWGLTIPQVEGLTESQYLVNVKSEITLLVADELHRMATPPAPTPLAGF